MKRLTISLVVVAFLATAPAAQANFLSGPHAKHYAKQAVKRHDKMGQSVHESGSGPKVSTKNQDWAAAYISGSQIQPAAASLRRKHHKWHLHQIGNGGGCGVPDKVQDDLKLACY